MEQPLHRRKDAQSTRKRKRKCRRRCTTDPQEESHSSASGGHKLNATKSDLALVRILPRLKPVLDFLDVKGDVFTRLQIMSHLTEYIKKKALYDPSDPRKVYCENDKLGEIFGCKEFSTANVCNLLLQNLENISTTSSSVPGHLKGKSCNSTLCCPPCKRASLSTTDTCSCSESDETSTDEFSIVAASGLKKSCDYAFSSTVNFTGHQSYTSTALVALPNNPCSEQPCTSSALASLQNNPSSEQQCTSSSLVSLPNNPCSEPKNNTSLTEYSRHYQGICENATDVVTDTSDDLFFLFETDEDRVVRQVDDDEGRFSPGMHEDEDEEEDAEEDEEEDIEEDEEEEEDSGDTEGEDGGDELGTSDSSDSENGDDILWQCQVCSVRNLMTRWCRRCWAARIDSSSTSLDRTTSGPSRILTEMAQIDPATVSDSASTGRIHTPLMRNVASDSTNLAPSEGNDAYGRMKCILCRKEPPNACIIHGQTGHQVCCVFCARKLKETNKPCPVCRKKISKVIKNFM